jgi:beta-lactam-binding protein with PASTA domain
MEMDGQHKPPRRRKRRYRQPSADGAPPSAVSHQPSGIQNLRSNIQNRESEIRDPKSEIIQPPPAASDPQAVAGGQWPVAGSHQPATSNQESEIQNPKPKIVSESSAISHPPSESADQQSKIQNLKSKIQNGGPPIRRRRFGRAVFLVLLAMVRLVVTTVLVLGLVGAAAYMTLKFYVGGREIKVPNVCGVSVEDALEKLDSASLLLKFDRREYSEVVPRGNIVAQFPAPGMKVKTGTPVRVALSDGAVRVRAPNLIGMTEINAGVAARATAQADLDVGPGATVYSPKVKKGDVIAQDPPPATPIMRGSKIKLLVSQGPRPLDYSMPDLRNKTIVEARASLSAMQLILAEVHEMDHAGAERGLVVAQRPDPGKRVTAGASVILTIATGLAENAASRPLP